MTWLGIQSQWKYTQVGKLTCPIILCIIKLLLSSRKEDVSYIRSCYRLAGSPRTPLGSGPDQGSLLQLLELRMQLAFLGSQVVLIFGSNHQGFCPTACVLEREEKLVHTSI
jgi:hypothetical protein